MSENTDDLPDPSDRFDASVLDESDILNERELNINPVQYIHMAIQRSQMALLNPNLEAGLTQYVFLVQQVELLCKSAGLVSKDVYDAAIASFKMKEEYVNEKRALYQHMMLSQEKLLLLLAEVFSNKTSSAPLKM